MSVNNELEKLRTEAAAGYFEVNLVVCILLRVLDHLKMVVRPKHVPDNFNKIINNY
jgi:hypothetical protein